MKGSNIRNIPVKLNPVNINIVPEHSFLPFNINRKPCIPENPFYYIILAEPRDIRYYLEEISIIHKNNFTVIRHELPHFPEHLFYILEVSHHAYAYYSI